MTPPPDGARPERWLLVAFVMRSGATEDEAHEIVTEVLRPHYGQDVTLATSQAVLRELEDAVLVRRRRVPR